MKRADLMLVIVRVNSSDHRVGASYSPIVAESSRAICARNSFKADHQHGLLCRHSEPGIELA